MGPKVSLDGRTFWPGANGSIPAEWVRATPYDGKFLQGGAAGFSAPANGGNVSHTHTVTAPHGHTGNPHTHSFSAGLKDAATTGVNEVIDFSPPWITYQPLVIPGGHIHVSKTSNSATITYQTTTPSIASDNTAPPSVRIIVIKPDGAEADIPDDAICFTDDSAAPTGYSITDGAGTTTDLDGKFLRGAEAGNDGDLTGEGSLNHTHDSSHTHVVDSHTHGTIDGGSSSTVTESPTTSPTVSVYRNVHHRVTFFGKTAILSTDDGNIDNASTEPAYVKLLGIQNTSGGALTSLGCIIGYIGSEANIPIGWELVASARDRQIKITKTPSEIGDINSSSNTHTHTTSSHTHTHTTHNHVLSVRQFNAVAVHNTPDDVDAVESGALHKHTWNVTSTVATLGSNTFTMSTGDGRLEYRTMIFIKRIAMPTVHILGNTNILGNTLIH